MRRRQAESYRAGFAAAVLPYVRADPIHLPQNLTSVPVENAAGRRRHNTLRASEQELGIQFELEVGDLLTQGWLGDEKFLGGFREASCIDDPDEIFELPNVHGGALLRVRSMDDIGSAYIPQTQSIFPQRNLACYRELNSIWSRK